MSGWPGAPQVRTPPPTPALAQQQPQTFRKHVAHVQHGHEVIDVTVDALGHARVLQGAEGQRAHGARPCGPPPSCRPSASQTPRLHRAEPRPHNAAVTPGAHHDPILPHLPHPHPHAETATPPLQLRAPGRQSLVPCPHPTQTKLSGRLFSLPVTQQITSQHPALIWC